MSTRRFSLAALTLAGLCAGAAGAQAAPNAPRERGAERGIVYVRVQGPLDVGTQSLLSRAIRTAKDDGSGLLIELDTLGGAIDLMWQLAGQLDDASESGVFTACWVHPNAISAGALLAIACDRIYMSQHGVIGAAKPVQQGPQGISEIVDESVREKVTSATRASFRAFAEKRGRPSALAEAMVDSDTEVREVKIGGETRLMTGSEWDDARERGETVELVTTIVPRGKLLSLSAEQALKYGLIDGIADKLPDVLTKLGAAGVEPIVLARTRSEDLAALLDALKVTLLAVGLLAIYWEFKTPGFGIPGIVAIVCFALFLFGRYLVGLADVWEMAAVVLGLVLIAVEIFLLPGQLWPGLVGAVLVLAGLVSVMVGPGVPWGYPLDRELLLDQVFRVALGLLAACVGGLVLSRFLPRTPVVRRLVLAPAAGGHSAGAVPESFMLGSSIAAPGARGTALTDLRPVGKVALDHDQGREFEARANGTAIDRGARVQVVEVQSGRLVVELEGVRSERG